MSQRVCLQPLSGKQEEAIQMLQGRLHTSKVAPLPYPPEQSANTNLSKPNAVPHINSRLPLTYQLESEQLSNLCSIEEGDDYKRANQCDQARDDLSNNSENEYDQNQQTDTQFKQRNENLEGPKSILGLSLSSEEYHWQRTGYHLINTEHAKNIYRYPQPLCISLLMSHVIYMATQSLYVTLFYGKKGGGSYMAASCMITFPFRSLGYIFYGDSISTWWTYRLTIVYNLIVTIILVANSTYNVTLESKYFALAIGALMILVVSYNIAERSIPCTTDTFTYKRIIFSIVRSYRFISIILQSTIVTSLYFLDIWWAFSLGTFFMFVDVFELYQQSTGSQAPGVYILFWALCEMAFCYLAILSYIRSNYSSEKGQSKYNDTRGNSQLAALKVTMSFAWFLFEIFKLVPQESLPKALQREQIQQRAINCTIWLENKFESWQNYGVPDKLQGLKATAEKRDENHEIPQLKAT